MHSNICRTLTILTIMACFILSGCDPDSTDSTNVSTSRIYANIDVEANSPDRSRVTVELNNGERDGTNIELTDGEKLEATVAGETRVLEKDLSFSDINYETTFNTSSSAEPFTIVFFRQDGTMIDGTSVSLPDEFIITSPESDETFDTSETLPLSWTPERADQTIELETFTSCPNNTEGNDTNRQFFELADDGEEDWELDQLTAATDNDLDRSKDCTLEITLIRRASGVLDSRFEDDGQIDAIQSRTIEDLVLQLSVE